MGTNPGTGQRTLRPGLGKKFPGSRRPPAGLFPALETGDSAGKTPPRMNNQVVGCAILILSGVMAAAEPAPVRSLENFDLGEVRLLEGPFRDAQERDLQYLLSLDPERLLVMFRSTAGIYSYSAYTQAYGGWESPTSGLRGHTMGHYLSACALMYASTGDERLKRRTDYLVGELARCQAMLAENGYHAGYLSAFPEYFFDRVDAQKPVWAPWYTMHKIMAGLLEVHVHTGNPQALEVLNRIADWVKFRVDRLTPEQMQGSLKTEHGGMNEVLANLYAVTGNPDHLRLAQAFNHRAVFDPLARGEDRLDGLHANTQFPKIIGAAREYELTGNEGYRDIARFFWREVAFKRSYAIGGNSDNEHFFPVSDFPDHLSTVTDETCNTYNMLKLTEHIFAWEPKAETMDFYERGLYNQILASQDPDSGMVTYFVPMKAGLFKTYSTPDNSFWCCLGTGMENHAKYGREIYAHDDRSLYVNLFIPSTLSWRERGLTVRQETRFPEEAATRLSIATAQPTKLALRVRQPAWCRAAVGLRVNGSLVEAHADSSGYVTIEREWRNGDRIDIDLPMSLRTEPLPGNERTVAIFYGPIVLAGELGTEGMPAGGTYAEDQKKFAKWPTTAAPVLAGDPAAVLAALRPVPGERLTFRTQGIGRPSDVTLIPFYRLHHQRYTLYWPLAPAVADSAAR
jgi:uncharacterized protein